MKCCSEYIFVWNLISRAIIEMQITFKTYFSWLSFLYLLKKYIYLNHAVRLFFKVFCAEQVYSKFFVKILIKVFSLIQLSKKKHLKTFLLAKCFFSCKYFSKFHISSGKLKAVYLSLLKSPLCLLTYIFTWI